MDGQPVGDGVGDPAESPTTLPDAELLDSPASLLLDAHDDNVDLSGVADTKDPRRVKVYEMKGDAWQDRGTGFCMGLIREVVYVNPPAEEGDEAGEMAEAEVEGAVERPTPGTPPSPAPPPRQQAYFLVKSEELRDSILLESKILKEDLYQIQQNTLIVWQEVDGTDVALSFQEEAGCLEIWNFLRHVQKTLRGEAWEGPVERLHGKDEELSEEEGESANDPIHLPGPSLAKLPEIEELVYTALGSIARRENLAKFILSEDYIAKLATLLEMAEDLESLRDLHRLCNIVKSFILLNDSAIFESILRDEVFLQVAGILEYDPDFPHHKAEHRKYLADKSKFKEVVPISDPEIRRKIHQTFRLQYIKDVILARMLDDPTFSILNTLIFFNQVDIVQHFQHNEDFLTTLFGLFEPDAVADAVARRDDAVLFIQQFCAIAKTLQPSARSALYQAFAHHGLLKVIVYSLSSAASRQVCLAGADILMATIDHDPKLVRAYILEQHAREEPTLAETLIGLLISERDLGVKAQMTEAVRLLTDPTAGPPMDAQGQPQKSEVVLRRREDVETEKFLEIFYEHHVRLLMAPLLEAGFASILTLPVETTQLYIHLCDLLCFFIRAHTFHSKFWILSTNISCAIAQIFGTREKHLQLAALRYMRVCIGANDDFYNRHLIKNRLLDPLVQLVLSSGDKPNLLTSAALEFFELIRRESMRGLIYSIAEGFKDEITLSEHAETLKGIVTKWEQWNAPPPPPPPPQLVTTSPAEQKAEGPGWQDAAREAAYFDEDAENTPPQAQHQAQPQVVTPTNVAAGVKRPLVSAEYDTESSPGATDGPLPDDPVEQAPKRQMSSASEKGRLPVESSVDQEEEQSIAAGIEAKLAQRERLAQEAAINEQDTVMTGMMPRLRGAGPSIDTNKGVGGLMLRTRRMSASSSGSTSPERKQQSQQGQGQEQGQKGGTGQAMTPGKKRLLSFSFGRKKSVKSLQEKQPDQEDPGGG